MNVPTCTHYEISLTIRPEPMHPAHKFYGGTVDVDCTITVENHTSNPVEVLPFLLYRLLHVGQVRDASGGELPFTQNVVTLQELPRHQVNAITVTLHTPLQVGTTTRVRLQYDGPVCGYPEVWPYIQDHVSERYSLLRQDVLWYPLMSEPVDAYSRAEYDYDLSVTVPQGNLIVIANGRLEARDAVEGGVRYRWRSTRATGRITVACAPFERLPIAPNVSLYYLAEDATGAQVVAQAVVKTRELCTTWFGELPPSALNLVEIPAGWGSEASASLILQTAGAFQAEDPDDRQAYRRALSWAGHEIVHLWNAPSREEHVSRFLNEGITQYVEALLLREEFGPDAYWQRMSEYRALFLSGSEAARSVPLAEAGQNRQVRWVISRGKGPWLLCVLDHLIGEQWIGSLRIFFDRHRTEGATLREFEACMVEASDRDLTTFFQEWLWGTASSELLAQDIPDRELIAALVERYAHDGE